MLTSKVDSRSPHWKSKNISDGRRPINIDIEIKQKEPTNTFICLWWFQIKKNTFFLHSFWKTMSALQGLTRHGRVVSRYVMSESSSICLYKPHSHIVCHPSSMNGCWRMHKYCGHLYRVYHFTSLIWSLHSACNIEHVMSAQTIYDYVIFDI